MMHFLVLAVLTSALGLSAQEARAPAGSNPASAGNAGSGLAEYEDVGCYQCHGYDALGPPRLAPGPLPYLVFSDYVRAPTGAMPPYTTKVLTDQQLTDIYAFLESIPETPDVDSIPILSND